MQIAVLKERRPAETRVAATPDTVKKLVALGCKVVVESGAGAGSNIADADFATAGAAIASDAAAALGGAEMVLKVQRPMTSDEGADEIAALPSGAYLMAGLNALTNKSTVQALAKQGVNAFALELMPRISRAQAMDILSSQSNLAGYKAVIDAAATFGRAMPMMMTAAGTVPAAKVFVMGAGVAGLQAIATARRMGAIVTATDVRPATKEQVESLGAKFVAVENEEFKQAETSGGYAKEMSPEYQKAQAELVAVEAAKSDIVITTALIPGRKAPTLVSADMLASMKSGSVIVDLAVESGGNVVGSESGKVVVTANGVTILGHANVPARLPRDASALYAKNVLNFLALMIEKGTGNLKINFDDELVKGTLVTKDGQVVHPSLAG
jgi:NAD(P) transhydrogenase subunit alpha